MKYVLNFSHPLTDEQKQQLEEKIGKFNLTEVMAQFDMEEPMFPQVKTLAEKVHFSEGCVVFPPAFGTAAALMVVCIFGLGIESFQLARLKAEAAPVRKFVLGELIKVTSPAYDDDTDTSPTGYGLERGTDY